MAEQKLAEPETQNDDLDVRLEDVGPARKCLTIEIPAQRISGIIEANYSRLGNDAVVPGFRKGRVPRRLLEKRFGSSLKEDTRNQLLGECYKEAIEQHKLDVIGEPDIKDLEEITLPDDGPLSFKVEVEVSPDVNLPDLKGIKVNKPKLTITDKDVDEEVSRLRERLGQTIEVKDTAVEEQDYIQADVRILVGKDASDDADQISHHPDTWVWVHGKAEDYKGHVAGIVVDKLGKHLLAKTSGDAVRISQVGPKQHEDERIKEQPITLVIVINSVHRHEPAELAQLIATMGADSEKELLEHVKQGLIERNERQQASTMHEQVCDFLLDKVDLALPEGLTSRQSARQLQRQAMEMAYLGTDTQTIEQKIAEMRQESTEKATRQLKQFFILDQAAKQLDIEVSESEVNGRITMLAVQQGRRPEKVRQEMSRQGEIESLYLQIREQKTLDKILEEAQIIEADAPTKEPKKSKETKEAAEKKTTKKRTTKKKTDTKPDTKSKKQ